MQLLHEALRIARRLKNHTKAVSNVGTLERDCKPVACQHAVTVKAVSWEPSERLRSTSLPRSSRAAWTDSSVVREHRRPAGSESACDP